MHYAIETEVKDIYTCVYGQFQMRGVNIQIFENRMHMKLYPVPHCEQVKVGRKINFSSVVTTMYLGGSPK